MAMEQIITENFAFFPLSSFANYKEDIAQI